MPYVAQAARTRIDQTRIGDRDSSAIDLPGELNYAITKLCVAYLESHTLSYQTINDILGALEGAKAEFYRRVAAPYEDTKIQTNGDIYP